MQGAHFFNYRLILAWMALCLCHVLVPAAANAETSPLHPCVLSVDKLDSIDRVLPKLAQFDCKNPQSQMAPGDYWVKLGIPLSMQNGRSSLVFRTASLWSEGFELWTVHANGSISYYAPFSNPTINPMRLGATAVVPLRSHASPVVLLVAKVKASAAVRGIMLESQISTAETAISYEMALATLYAGFVGICIALLAYNIALWRGMREPYLLAYCAMVAATLSYGIITSGAPHYFFSAMTAIDRLRITIPLLALTGGTVLIFIRYFFANTQIPKWLARLSWAQAFAMSGYAVMYAALAPSNVKLLDAIYVYGFTPIPFLLGAYIWVAWSNRDPFLIYFLVAWTGPAASAAFRILHGFDILPYHTLIENSTLLGLGFEALVSSLAIGHRVRLLSQARDRAEIAEAHAMIMADTDSMTGLLNRRAFLRTLLERNSHWTLVLVDIDHFKRVNDSLGHAGGDEAIIMIANALVSEAPEGALVARLGGEEFAIAYRGNLLLMEPEDLLAKIRSIDLPQGYRITASIGIANRNVGNEHDWKILYRAADMALYQAKSNGRNRCIHLSMQAQAA
ncbi:MAG: diguanylate cyclase [Sphingorhabdus sp.]